MSKDKGPPIDKHQRLLALVRRARTVLSALGSNLQNSTIVLALTALMVEQAQAAAKSKAASDAEAAKQANKSHDQTNNKSAEKQSAEDDKKDVANAEKSANDKADKSAAETPDTKAADASKATEDGASKLVVSAQDLLRAVLEDEASYQTALAQNRTKDSINSAPDAVLANA